MYRFLAIDLNSRLERLQNKRESFRVPLFNSVATVSFHNRYTCVIATTTSSEEDIEVSLQKFVWYM